MIAIVRIGHHRVGCEVVAPVGRGAGQLPEAVYSVDNESPTDYDVVINTERLTPDAAGGLILGLVQRARRRLRRQRYLCACLAADLPCHVDYPGQGSECLVAASVVNQG
jgi:hypothetical protein